MGLERSSPLNKFSYISVTFYNATLRKILPFVNIGKFSLSNIYFPSLDHFTDVSSEKYFPVYLIS